MAKFTAHANLSGTLTLLIMHSSLSLSFLLTLVCIFLQPSPSQTYYLSPTGSDAANGTSPQTAWQTLQRANQHDFNSGDRLLLQGGATFTGMLSLTEQDAGTPQQPVTISSFGKVPAVIINPDTSAVSIQNAGGIVVSRLIVKSPERTKNRGYGIQFVNTLPNADQRRFVRIDSVQASGFGYDGIWLGGKPADNSQSGFTDVRISRCVLFDNQYHGLYVTGTWDTNAKGYANHDVHINHCVAYENTGDPLYLANHSGSGMEIDNVEDAVIEYCAAYRNGYLCNARVGGPCGIWLHAANRAVIQHCVSIGNRTGRGLDGAGFDLDGGTTNSRIQYCYARDNDGAGILVWNYEKAPHRLGDNAICYNILENNGKANDYADIHIGTSGTPITNMQLYNNTVFTSRQPTGKQRCLWIGPNVAIGIYNNLLLTNGNIPPIDIAPQQAGVQLAGNSFGPVGQLRLSAVNTAESPTPETLKQLKAYRPQTGSPLKSTGVLLSVKGVQINKAGFWGKPIDSKSVGAGF